MQLSILIVSYNTREFTLACLQSVYEQTRGVEFEIIVVDNASNDGSAKAIETSFPQVRLIQLDKNVGFAAGNNLAAREATGDWLLLLNPDTVVLDRAIQKVYLFATEKSGVRSQEWVNAPANGWHLTGISSPKFITPYYNLIVGGRTFFADGSLNPTSCHGAPTLWSLLCMGVGISSVFRRSRLFDPESLGRWKRDSVREVDAITGCFLLINRKLWQRLGGFDESFFMYGEETDLCWRARKVGIKCVICPEAQLIHYGGKSEKTRADKMVRLFAAKVRLFEKHWRPGHIWFGIRMLELWAWSRMAALNTLRWFNPSLSEGYHTWREIWRRRNEYRNAQFSAIRQEVTHG
jgi:GT2 family glycosyltransferase